MSPKGTRFAGAMTLAADAVAMTAYADTAGLDAAGLWCATTEIFMIPNHPDREQIRLENVLTALGHPLRLAVVRALASGGERACGSLLQGQSKSTMTHHWRVLRDSGVIWQRPYGRENLLSLRREDLDDRFPDLLDSLLGALENDPITDETTAQHLLEPVK